MSSLTRVAAILAGLLLIGSAFAQPAPDYVEGDSADQNVVDPPSRVARLSLINGPISFVPAGENDWVEAQINRPLITGDKLWADRGGRAELQIGEATVRVDEQSSFSFLNLNDQNVQIELTQGTLNLRVRRILGNQSYEVDTPTLAFVVNRVGEYRLDVAPDGHGTIVTAFHGSGDAYGEGGARFRVEEAQSIRFNDPQLRDYASNGVPDPDAFDRFCFDRDARWDNSASRQYVSEEVIGYQDLDSYGSWTSDAEYGNVWYPTTVDVGWTPYSYGHWGWVGAYGWTWIDASPWGFAPFHYGRWAYVNNRWGWCPGDLHARPYYAPALVAFIGGGGPRPGFGAGGPVGWFPLGPRDVYVPGYHVSRDYFVHVNAHAGIANVTINNYYTSYARGGVDYARLSYANRNVSGAVVAVPAATFVSARQIHGAAVAVNRETFGNAQVYGFAAVAPTHASLAFTGTHPVNAPPAAMLNRKIVAATQPPPPVASFAQRQTVLQANPGRPLTMTQLHATPVVLGNGAQAAHAAAIAHPNVTVVTTSGQAAVHSTAPTTSATATKPTYAPATVPSATYRSSSPQSVQQQTTSVPKSPSTPTSSQPMTVQSRTFSSPQTTTNSAPPQHSTLPSSHYIAPATTSSPNPETTHPNTVPHPVHENTVREYHAPATVEHNNAATQPQYHAPVVQNVAPRVEPHVEQRVEQHVNNPAPHVVTPPPPPPHNQQQQPRDNGKDNKKGDNGHNR